MGRATQGVRLIRLNDNDEISSVEKIEKINGEDNIADENNDTNNQQENDSKD